MASIYLIRHGQASFGADDYDKLSELGRLQAQLTGEHLAHTGVRFDTAYCGKLRRQRDTAELALAAQHAPVPLIEDARLDEVRNDEHLEYLLPRVLKTRPDIQALVDQGLDSSKRFQKVIEAVFNLWVSPECDEPSIQSWEEYSGGVRSMLADIVQTQGAGKTTAIFTSGGTIATLVASVLGVPGSLTYQFYEPVFNCSITQLFYNRERVSLSYFNDCSFLRHLAVGRGKAGHLPVSAPRVIYLVRHGEAAASWGESADPGLSDLGREQAEQACARLHSTLDRAPQLVSSPLLRAQQTAEPLARQLGVDMRIDERFREIPSPVPLAKRQDWLRAFMRGRWSEQDATLRAWRTGILKALDSLPDRSVVFSHFLVLNTIVGWQEQRDETLVFWPANASITELRGNDTGRWQVSLGEQMHSRVN